MFICIMVDMYTAFTYVINSWNSTHYCIKNNNNRIRLYTVFKVISSYVSIIWSVRPNVRSILRKWTYHGHSKSVPGRPDSRVYDSINTLDSCFVHVAGQIHTYINRPRLPVELSVNAWTAIQFVSFISYMIIHIRCIETAYQYIYTLQA